MVPETAKLNFQTLCLAAEYEDIALVRSVRKSDGRAVSLVCAMTHAGGEIIPLPLAELIEGNPYDMYFDPTAENLPLGCEK